VLKLFFDNGNFRNFLIFQAFFGIGSGIFSIFMMWAVHAQYQNPIYTGIAGFMFVAPRVASFLVGPFVDKHNKIKILRVSCFVNLCIVALLLAIPYAYRPGVWFLHLAILIFSITGIFAGPAITALMPKIVGSDDLVKANALIRVVSTIAGLGIGVLLYTMMYGGTGFELIYAVNTGVLFLALAFSFFVRSKERKEFEKADRADLKTYFTELKAGLIFIKRGAIFPLVLALVFMSLFADIAYVNLPMFAEIHTGMASGYILLTALALVGGLIGSYISRIIEHKFELWKILVFGLIFTGALRIIFVNVIADNFSRAVWIYILYAGLGSAIGIFINTLMQKLPPQGLIARINTVITSLSGIAAAAGALIGGIAGTLLPNVDMVFIIQGVSYITIGAFLWMFKHIRRLPKVKDVEAISD